MKTLLHGAGQLALAGAIAFASLASPSLTRAGSSPVNDDLTHPDPIPDIVAGRTFDDVDMTAATYEAGEPFRCGIAPAGTVWYTFTYGPTATGRVQVDAPGAKVTVFFGEGVTGMSDLSAGFCGPGGIASSSLLIPWYANRVELVQITNDGTTTPITVRFSILPPPVNDNVAAATLLDEGQVSIVDTRAATLERDGTTIKAYEFPTCTRTIGQHSAWYRIVPSRSGIAVIDPAGSAIPDLVVSAFHGDPPLLERVGCSPTQTALRVPVQAGESYWIHAIDGGPSGGGSLHLAWTLEAPLDVTAPWLSLPVDSTVEADGPSGTEVEYAPVAWDAVDGAVDVSCSPSSGSTLPLGATTVSCSAIDAAGNRATATFTVTVRDTVAPVVVFSAHPSTYALTDLIRITCSASDVVGVVSSTCQDTLAYGWEIGLGAKSLSATASDLAGNRATSWTTFTVTATYASVSDLTKQWVSKAGVARDLVAILDGAAAAQTRGSLSAEASKLVEYRAAVLAQAGKSLTVARAQLLVTSSYGL